MKKLTAKDLSQLSFLLQEYIHDNLCDEDEKAVLKKVIVMAQAEAKVLSVKYEIELAKKVLKETEKELAEAIEAKENVKHYMRFLINI